MSSDSINNSVTIILAGQERTLKATFKAMREIERVLQRPWASLGNMVVSGTMGVTEMATIIHQGLLGFNDTRLSFDEVGEAVVAEGIQTLLDPVTSFILIGFRGAKVATAQAGEPPQA